MFCNNKVCVPREKLRAASHKMTIKQISHLIMIFHFCQSKCLSRPNHSQEKKDRRNVPPYFVTREMQSTFSCGSASVLTRIVQRSQSNHCGPWALLCIRSWHVGVHRLHNPEDTIHRIRTGTCCIVEQSSQKSRERPDGIEGISEWVCRQQSSCA